MGLNGPYGKGEKGLKGWPHPSPWTSPNWTREGGRPFLPSPSLFPFLLSYSYYMEGLLVGLGKEGILLPVGVGLLPGAPPPRPATPSLAPLYTGAGGHPRTHKLIYGLFLSRVRCPPPPYSTSVISSRSLGEALRRKNIIIVTTPSC